MKLERSGDWYIPKREGLDSTIEIIGDWEIKFRKLAPDTPKLVSMGFEKYFYKKEVVREVDGYAHGLLETNFYAKPRKFESVFDLMVLSLYFSYPEIEEETQRDIEAKTTLELMITKDEWGDLIIRNDEEYDYEYTS